MMVKIFISNLAGDEGEKVITEKHIKPLFDTFGTVTGCAILESKGYGFVHMPNPKEAKKAVRDLDGWRVCGRRITVELSQEHCGGKKSTKESKEAKGKRSSQDCYFFQNETCSRDAQCPYLHRILPKTVCRLFLFEKCKRPAWCKKQHVSSSDLPPASKEELARVRQIEMEKKVHSEVNDNTTNATGAIKKKTKKKESVPPFQCRDCGVVATSSFLLETHLNSEEHWEIVKQVMLNEEVLEQAVGDAVCKVEDVKDILVSRIPKDMSEGTLLQICLQFGKVNRLKLIGRHAYVRYSNVEEREFAVIKLKELQKCHFAAPSENCGKSESVESCEEGDVTNACLFRNGHYETGYFCDFCGNVSDSMKKHKTHTRIHERPASGEQYLFYGEQTVPYKPTELRESSSSDNETSKPSAVIDHGHLDQLNYQLDQLALCKNEQMVELINCQNQIKIYKQASGNIGNTIELLEKELEIQRRLRDLEVDIQKLKMNTNPYYYMRHASLTQVDQNCNLENSNFLNNPLSKPFFHPDDVFNSEDSLDE